jgi:hypothetical protein
MILIGLFGGSPESREEISRVLTRAAGASLGCYALYPTEGLSGVARGEKLDVVLHGLTSKVNTSGLLISHVLSAEEAQAIRARGGSLWHVMGEPSDVISIQPGDLPVTAFAGGCRHYLDAIEAYSEVLLAQGRAR